MSVIKQLFCYEQLTIIEAKNGKQISLGKTRDIGNDDDLGDKA